MFELASEVTRVARPEEVELPDELLEGEVSKEDLDREVERLRDRHATIVPSEGPARQGDFVLLAGDGGTRMVNTGRPYDRTDEDACLGLSVGDAVTLSDGRSWRVRSIRRKELPPFDDALVAADGRDDVRTCDEFLDAAFEHLARRMRADLMMGASEVLADGLVAASTYELAPEERERFERLFAEDGPRDEEELPEFLGAFGLDPEATTDPDEAVRLVGRRMLERTVLGLRLMGERGAKPDEAQYERYLRRSARERGVSVDEVRGMVGVDDFLMDRGGNEVSRYATGWIRKSKEIRVTRGA